MLRHGGFTSDLDGMQPSMRSVAKRFCTLAFSPHLLCVCYPHSGYPRILLFFLLVVGIGAILVAELEASYQAPLKSALCLVGYRLLPFDPAMAHSKVRFGRSSTTRAKKRSEAAASKEFSA